MGRNVYTFGQCHFAMGSHPFLGHSLLTGPVSIGLLLLKDAGNFHVGQVSNTSHEVFMETWQVQLGLCRTSWSHN
jgi:hypothetical protein